MYGGKIGRGMMVRGHMTPAKRQKRALANVLHPEQNIGGRVYYFDVNNLQICGRFPRERRWSRLLQIRKEASGCQPVFILGGLLYTDALWQLSQSLTP